MNDILLNTSPSHSLPHILLTGATGYIGGRLLNKLHTIPCQIRCLARRPENLQHIQDPRVKAVSGDLLDRKSLNEALKDIDVAFYLVHSMSASGSFAETDRQAARNFGEAAREAGVKRIVYVGGLGDSSADLSPHLKSRQEVGAILRESGVPVIEFRAGVVIGSGSLSFEMIRTLVERLPVMVTPRWVSIPTQPISIEELLQYLVKAVDCPLEESRIFEIGGSDVVSYGKLMQEYARQRGLKRYMIPVPVLTPYLSSLWLALVTPLYARVGRKLIDSIRNPTVVQDHTAQEFFNIQPRTVSEAISSALCNEERQYAETRWSDALSSTVPQSESQQKFPGARLMDSRTYDSTVPPELAFRPIRMIGGNTGWYCANGLWKIRGWIDLLCGGVGMRRGRRDPETLRVGDALDWWRVEAYEENRLLRLSAEMKLPGRAWLQFEVEPKGTGSTVRQTALFDPQGLWGLLYWYSLYPIHCIIFQRMIRRIAKAGKQFDKQHSE